MAKKKAKSTKQSKTKAKSKSKPKAKKSAGSTKKKKPVKKASKKSKATAQAVETLLRVGQRAPDFALQSESGATVRLSEVLNQGQPKKVVLYFYPKDDTPGCTQESCDFRDNFGRVKSAGAEVFGISRDDVRSHEKFKNKYSLPFSLLADVEGKVTEAYGVWKEKSMYGRKYMGIERTTFIIGTDGRIEQIYPKVSVTGHVDQVIQDLSGDHS